MPAPWIDISRPVHPGMAVWPGDPATQFDLVQDLAKGDACTVTRLSMCVHAGTHLDAPSHYLPGGPDMTAMPIETGIGEARVIGIEDPVAVTAAELTRHDIRRGERLLFQTANSARLAGPGPFAEDFTYVAADAARYLAEKKVRLVGVDYLSVGGFHDDGAATHRILLEAGIWLLEGLDLSGLSPGLVELVCLPLKLVGTEGAPARAVARQLARTVARHAPGG
ncbi:cyclase family protein [Desulfovibrio sulfodismutans]|uniref:Kynurenine formamidase n=1 Tax=Desulfolutivibrio sulfodismutans TaxID=63561 RepID=A0A7K3NQI6_9BACT|nr:cyclase family protein [Desulfolutivibrio sulfodismutans]NDY58441.1 cyclase family protein [Desulfolutivibrio sulfodismutans]QLA14123.1 cyclase family protein [Desulfolutivibrio sulfodismutans DSM 3696]